MKAALLAIRRFGAFAADWILFGIGSFPITLLFWFGGVDEIDAARFQTVLLWAWLIYYALFEWAYGATIGKFVFRLAVRRRDGTRLSLLSAIGRAGLTFIIPCGLSVFVAPVISFFYSTNLTEQIGLVISTAILAAVPVSLPVFEGQSLADVLLKTCVVPAKSFEKITVLATPRRWALVGLLSLLIGLSFSWIMTLISRNTYGADSMDEAGRQILKTFPTDLMPESQPLSENERKMTMDIRGDLIRGHGPLTIQTPGKNFVIDLYGSATSYDELLIMKRLATHMADLPDEERPKCTNVTFIKAFEAVMTRIQQQHEMAICDVPKGLPSQATLVDRNLGVSWQFKLNADDVLTSLIGASGGPFKFAWIERKLDRP